MDEQFDIWWERESKRVCHSLMVATENATVKEKARAIFKSGFECGLLEAGKNWKHYIRDPRDQI